MKPDVLTLICCPQCRAPLTVQTAAEAYDELWSGSLVCAACTAVYPIRQGIPHLHLSDASWQSKALEAQGWITIHKELGIYEVVPDSVDLSIPYYPEEPWTRVARSFDLALDALQLTGRETILDLGAGRGWAAKEFARRGCRVVALDVADDENVGLGRAKALMTHAGVYFERIIGDGENLPFPPERFDLVFCAAALHHSSNLPLFLKNIHAVLKPGGRLCAINEPCIGITEDPAQVLTRDAGHELQVGINETRPNLLDYDAALRAAGFTRSRLLPAEGMQREAQSLLAWARELGAARPALALGLSRPALLLGQLRRYVQHRASALRQGRFAAARRYLAARSGREALESAVLTWAGGELFLLAYKPEAGA